LRAGRKRTVQLGQGRRSFRDDRTAKYIYATKVREHNETSSWDLEKELRDKSILGIHL